MKDYSFYHDDNINDKIVNDGNLILDKALDGFLGCDVIINSNAESSRAYITSKFTSNDNYRKNIIMPIGSLSIGDLVTYNDQKWLIIAFPEDNKIYEHSVIELCNNTLTIPLPDIQTIIDYDEMQNPIYSDPLPQDPLSIPCIINGLDDTYQSNLSQSIAYTNADVSLTIQNSANLNATLSDKTFTMFANTYHIYGFQYDKTFDNDKGLLIVLAHNTASEAGGS
jgi:hypothetical protein